MREPLAVTLTCAVLFFTFAVTGGAASLHKLQPQDFPSQDSASEVERLASQLSSSSEEERFDAAVSLSIRRGAEAAAALRTVLNDASERVRATAINGLAAMGDTQSAPLIAKKLREDKSVFVRKQAAYALGKLRSREWTAALVSALKDKKEEVRGAAAYALGEYGDESATEALIRSLKDKNAFVRAQSARALGGIGRAAAVSVLIKLLASDKDDEVKRQSARSLGLIGDPAALPALESASQSADPFLSEAALESMKKIREK